MNNTCREERIAEMEEKVAKKENILKKEKCRRKLMKLMKKKAKFTEELSFYHLEDSDSSVSASSSDGEEQSVVSTKKKKPKNTSSSSQQEEHPHDLQAVWNWAHLMQSKMAPPIHSDKDTSTTIERKLIMIGKHSGVAYLNIHSQIIPPGLKVTSG